MRWNRQQLDEATTNARQSGFKDGRKFARRRFFLGFFFGIFAGAGGLYAAATHQTEIKSYVHRLSAQTSSFDHPFK